MPLVLEESRARGVPVGSKLLVKVVTTSTDVNATGQVAKPTGGEETLKHSEIMNRVKRVSLAKTGRHIARVNLILNATTDKTATVEYTIENAAGDEIKAFKPKFTGKSTGNDKFVGRAKYFIAVV
jgi:hypothetical protein